MFCPHNADYESKQMCEHVVKQLDDNIEEYMDSFPGQVRGSLAWLKVIRAHAVRHKALAMHAAE